MKNLIKIMAILTLCMTGIFATSCGGDYEDSSSTIETTTTTSETTTESETTSTTSETSTTETSTTVEETTTEETTEYTATLTEATTTTITTTEPVVVTTTEVSTQEVALTSAVTSTTATSVTSTEVVITVTTAEAVAAPSNSLSYVKHFSRGTYYAYGTKGGSGRTLIDCSIGDGTVKGSIASSYLYKNYGYNYNGKRTMVYLEVEGYSQMNGYYYLDDSDAGNSNVIDFFFYQNSNCPFQYQGVVPVECYIVNY